MPWTGFVKSANNMESQKLTIGRIVEFFPGTGDSRIELPNHMTSAPAIAIQVFDQHANLNLFVAPTGSGNGSHNTITAWSISHKSNSNDGALPHWDWLPRV